ncbi:MAG: YggS family pyridoxal phosphate-dependent enzyme [Dokdonella sp.]
MPHADNPESTFRSITDRIAAAAAQAAHPVTLLAVSKGKPASEIRELVDLGQTAFGENYVQEALAKQQELANTDIEWHMIGPLQSNKCRDVSEHFDWLQTLDRERLIEPLARWRPPTRAPLNVLIQVNIDDEESKSGCSVDAIAGLAECVVVQPMLHLRGLMAIPAPTADMRTRAAAFSRMRTAFEQLRKDLPGIDTLSMGMSDDFELSIAEGATLVRIGTALFGARAAKSD